jgi:hypothetical protein
MGISLFRMDFGPKVAKGENRLHLNIQTLLLLMKNTILLRSLTFVCAGLLLLTACKQEETATKILMQGNWELTAATDETGKDILGQLNFPVTVMQLTDDNGMLGTFAPLATRVVYGDSKWTQISGKINQVFDYANFRFNTGEFFVGEGVANVFTVEYKLQATAIAGGALTDILQIIGVNTSWLQQTVYHKFTNVSVSFPDKTTGTSLWGSKSAPQTANTMIWEFTPTTQPFYNYKDSQGNQVLWNGWPIGSFSKGKFTWTRRTMGINDLVKARI